MNLTYEQIKSIAFGWVKVTETENGLQFYKCTQKQIDAWYALSQTLGVRAEKTVPGVRLDFHTDSKRLSFEANGNFEVYVNDLFRAKFKMEELGGRAEMDLCDALNQPLSDVRVTLIFPSHFADSVLKSVTLDDGAYVKPHQFDRKILFIGDSITQGWDSGYDSLSYAWRLIRYFNADAVIHGIGGGYFHPSTFDHIEFDPDFVILALGTNDFGKNATVKEMTDKAAAFMDLLAAEYKGKKIFYISPTWRAAQEKPMGSFAECRNALIREATARGLIHINGLDMVPPDPTFFADETPLHPNALGFGIYAENLIREMQKYL